MSPFCDTKVYNRSGHGVRNRNHSETEAIHEAIDREDWVPFGAKIPGVAKTRGFLLIPARELHMYILHMAFRLNQI